MNTTTAEYRLVAVNDRTGKRTTLTGPPVTLKEAYTIRGKFNPHRDVRIVVEYNIDAEAPV